MLCVPACTCSVKKGTEQAAQAAVETASNIAGSVRAGGANVASNIADTVRSAPDNLQQVSCQRVSLHGM